MESFTESVNPANIEVYVNRYRRHLVNSHLELLILSYVEKESLCGYDIISMIHDRFRVLLSPGQVYPVINYLVGHGLISKTTGQRRVVLSLTPSGQQLLNAWKHELGSIQLQLSSQVMSAADMKS